MDDINPYLGFSHRALNELLRLNLEELRLTEEAVTQQRGTKSELYWLKRRAFLLTQGKQLIRAI